MDNKTVLIISEHPGDIQALSSALSRAEPKRFVPVAVDTRDQPVEALMDPGNDAVILGYSRETEYLLRLAQNKKLSIPIIALIDEESGSLLNKLYAAGATDYILRDHIVADKLFQKLEGKPELKPPSQESRESQFLKADARPVISPSQDAASRLAQVAPDAPAPADVKARPAPAPPRRNHSIKPAGKAAPLALAVSAVFAAPWKVTIVATVAGLILLSGNLLSQRLASESRLARLEAINDLLARQLLQLHSDFTQRALAPANPAVVYTTAPVPVVSAQPPPALPAPVNAAPPNAPSAVASAAPEHLETDSVTPITPITEPRQQSWFINLGTFSSGGAARLFANSLGPSSHRREIHKVVMDGRSLYRVRVVELPSVEAAEALALDYQVTLGGGRPWVGRN